MSMLGAETKDWSSSRDRGYNPRTLADEMIEERLTRRGQNNEAVR